MCSFICLISCHRLGLKLLEMLLVIAVCLWICYIKRIAFVYVVTIF